MSLYLMGWPKAITFNDTNLKEVWYGGKKVWSSFEEDSYVITGTIQTTVGWEWVGDGDCMSGQWSGRDCQCSAELQMGLHRILEIKIKGPIKHNPVKYISKSGATVEIDISKFGYDKETNMYNHSFGWMYDASDIASVYPVSGVTGYSNIASCDIEVKEYVPEPEPDPDQGQCPQCEQIDCDCAGDME